MKKQRSTTYNPNNQNIPNKQNNPKLYNSKRNNKPITPNMTNRHNMLIMSKRNNAKRGSTSHQENNRNPKRPKSNNYNGNAPNPPRKSIKRDREREEKTTISSNTNQHSEETKI